MNYKPATLLQASIILIVIQIGGVYSAQTGLFFTGRLSAFSLGLLEAEEFLCQTPNHFLLFYPTRYQQPFLEV